MAQEQLLPGQDSKTRKEKTLEALAAALIAAGDEASFGLLGKQLTSTGKELLQDHGFASGAGRIGSYFVPLPSPGKLKAITKIPGTLGKAAELAKIPFAGQAAIGKGAEKAAEKLLGFMGNNVAGAAARGTVAGGMAGGANHMVRTALGTHDDEAGPPSSALHDLLNSMAWGGMGGAAGHVLKKIAPMVYQHPALMNKFDPKRAEELANELLERGVYGPLSTFKKAAQEYKGRAKPVFDLILDRVGTREATDAATVAKTLGAAINHPVPTPKGMIDVRDGMMRGYNRDMNKWKRAGVGEAEKKALAEGYSSGARAMKPDKFGATNVYELDESLHAANDRLSKLSARDQARRSGAQGLGENSAEIDRVQSLKDTYEDMYRRRMRQGKQHNLETRYDIAQKTHNKGANLDRNIQAYELYNQNSPGPWYRDLLRNTLDYSISSPFVRTGTGVAFDRAGKGAAGQIAGRLSELRDRRQQNSAGEKARKEKKLDPASEKALKKVLQMEEEPAEPKATARDVKRYKLKEEDDFSDYLEDIPE